MGGQFCFADPPHQQRRAAEQSGLGQHGQRNRRADHHDLLQAVPFRPPPAPEDAIAPQLAVASDHHHIGDQHRDGRDHARQGRAHQAERRQAQIAEHQRPVAEDIGAERQQGDRGRIAGLAERGDEDAEHAGKDHRDHREGQHGEEFARHGRYGRVLTARQQQRFAREGHAHADEAEPDRHPHPHPHRAADIAHRMEPPPALGRDQRGAGADKSGHRPHRQTEDRNREAGGGQRLVTQPGDEDHVDRMDQHLQQIGRRQRHRERECRADFMAPAGRR